jgi:hypothetical protein
MIGGRAGRKSSVARSELNEKLVTDLNFAFENPSSMDDGRPKIVEMGSFVKKIGSKYVLSEYQRQDNNWCGRRKFGFIMAVCKGTADLQITCLTVPMAQNRRVTRATSEDVYHIWDGGHRCHTLHAFVVKNEPVPYTSSNIPLFFNEPTVDANTSFFRKVTDKAPLPDGTRCVTYNGDVYTPKDMSYTVFNERQRETFLENRNVTCMSFNCADVSPEDMSKYIVDRHLGQKPEQGEIIQMMRATKTPALDALDETLKRNGWITEYFANKAMGVKMLSYMLCSVHEDTKQGSTSWFHRNIFSFFLPRGVFAEEKRNKIIQVFDHFRPIATESKLAQPTPKNLVFHATVAMGFALALYWDSCPERLTLEVLNKYLDDHATRKGETLPSFIHIAKQFSGNCGTEDKNDEDAHSHMQVESINDSEDEDYPTTKCARID